MSYDGAGRARPRVTRAPMGRTFDKRIVVSSEDFLVCLVALFD